MPIDDILCCAEKLNLYNMLMKGPRIRNKRCANLFGVLFNEHDNSDVE